MMPRPLNKLIPTTVVGSYPQPPWLVDLDRLKDHIVPRVRAHDIWRVAPPLLAEAQDDATLIAIRDMERAGIDIISDGEVRRESYSNHFIMGLSGVDLDRPAKVEAMPGHWVEIPRVAGPIRRLKPIEIKAMKFLRANTDRATKITLPGPFTLSQQAHNEFYEDDEAIAMAFAAVINEEALALQCAGADVIQIDEPWLRRDPAAASRYGIKAINRAFQGITVTKAIHLCFGYAFIAPGQKPTTYPFLEQLADTVVDHISVEAAQPHLDLASLHKLTGKTIMLGVLDLSTAHAEAPEDIAALLRSALKFIPADRLVAAPDCGMKYMALKLAFEKLAAMAQGAAMVRNEINGRSELPQ
jgi:5-methyltetrahydropteroyltriglutamate--homocysteine methyltransferase